MENKMDSDRDREPPFHRLVPPLIGEMSVVRHQVYWYSGTIHDRSHSSVFDEIGDIKEMNWLPEGWDRGLFRRCQFDHLQSNKKMKYFYVWWRSLLVHVRIRQHTEYVSILTSINFSRNVETGGSGINDVGAYARRFGARRDKIASWFTGLGSPGRYDDRKTPQLEELLGPLDSKTDSSLFAKFDRDFRMAELHNRILQTPPGTGKGGQDGSPLSAKTTSGSRPEKIIDFRGLVTSAPRPEARRRAWRAFRKAGARGKLFKPCFKDAAVPLRETGLFISEDYLGVIEEEKELLASGGRSPWFVTEIGRYWRAVRPDAEVEDLEEIEFSATGLLDGRAIFITHQAKPLDEQRPPVRFFLHCKWSDERQIGRIVDRLCMMATARAAVERHAAPILFKGDNLRMVLGSIQKSLDGLNFQNTILNRILLKQDDEGDETAAEDDQLASSQSKTEAHGLGEGDRSAGAEATDEGSDQVQPSGEAQDVVPDLSPWRRWIRGFKLIWARIRPQGEKANEPDLLAVRITAAINDDAAKRPVDYFSLALRGRRHTRQTSRDVLRTLSGGMTKLENAIHSNLKFSEDTAPWDADDYFEYKVDRAAYHYEKLSRLEKQIRVARVEGFQTYPELVRRRVEDAFVFVRNAKDRLREIAEQRTRMSDQIGNITQIVEAHESDEEQRKIAEIQDFAEFALLTFLLPYYFGYMLNDVVLKLRWVTEKYEVFFWLIILFTGINLIKRWVEGKLATEFWVPPKKGSRRILGFLSSINVLSIAAIFAALFLLGKLPWLPGQAGKSDSRTVAESTAVEASPGSNAAKDKAPAVSNTAKAEVTRR